MLDRAQDLFKKALDGDGKKTSANSDWSKRLAKGVASSEKIGTRFDRLLVKAVDRTLSSDNDKGISKSVGGVLGNLIERFQNKDSDEKADRQRETRRNRKEERSSSSRRDTAANNANNFDNQRNSNSSSTQSNASSSSTPDPSAPIADALSSGSGKMSDLIPDLSGVNPTYVFTFFAITGFLLFVGYLLTQSIVGNETQSRKRSVIKQVRNTKIRSPKDLVETVDMFLLAKFGIKSSWWNARLAQQVLHSGSPDLKNKVDELFRDYVRARYMRNDIEIPTADQQRYKATLEELSVLDIAPKSDLRATPPRRSMNSSAAMEG